MQGGSPRNRWQHQRSSRSPGLRKKMTQGRRGWKTNMGRIQLAPNKVLVDEVWLTWKGCPHVQQEDQPHFPLGQQPPPLPSPPQPVSPSLSCSPKHFPVIRRTLKKSFLRHFLFRNFNILDTLGPNLKSPLRHLFKFFFFLRNFDILDTFCPNLEVLHLADHYWLPAAGCAHLYR